MAFGDIVQTVKQNVWDTDKTLPFAAPTPGNLLVLRVADSGDGTPPTLLDSIWRRAAHSAGLWGGTVTGTVAIYYRVADGTETGVNFADATNASGGAASVQEFDAAGLGWHLEYADVGDGSGTGTSVSAPAAAYNNATWPLIVALAVGIVHENAQPSTFAQGSSFDGINATGIHSEAETVNSNTNFATVAGANWVLPADQASDTGTLTWSQSNPNNQATAIFRGIAAPFLVDVTTQQAGTGTTVTPDFSALDIRNGDLVLVHHTNRNANDVAAPGSQGWSTVYAISRAVGTAFKEVVFAKIWGAGATDDSTPTFTVASGTLGHGATASIYRNPFHAVRPWTSVSDAIIASGTNNAHGLSATITAPSVNYTPGDDRTYVRFWSSADNNVLNNPSGGRIAYSGANYDSTAGDDFAQASVRQEDQDGASSTGTLTIDETAFGNDFALMGTLVLACVDETRPLRPPRRHLAAVRRASSW